MSWILALTSSMVCSVLHASSRLPQYSTKMAFFGCAAAPPPSCHPLPKLPRRPARLCALSGHNSAKNSVRKLVVRLSAAQHTQQHSSSRTSCSPQLGSHGGVLDHAVRVRGRRPEREARALDIGLHTHNQCGVMCIPAYVHAPRVDGGEPEHTDHLVEEDKRAREASYWAIIWGVSFVSKGRGLGD